MAWRGRGAVNRPQAPRVEGGELLDSTTFYVGNLSFYTTEEQVFELFSKCVCAAGLGACTHC